MHGMLLLLSVCTCYCCIVCSSAGIMADPWFRTDLPPDALNMNDKYLANTRTCAQSETDMKTIVAAATNYNNDSMHIDQGL